MVEGATTRGVGVLGATSLVGECLLPLLKGAGWQVKAYSRRAREQANDGGTWRPLESSLPEPLAAAGEKVPCWICLAPIWVVPKYFGLFEAHGARRLVVFSSTSRFSKEDSSDQEERRVASRLAEAEAEVRAWAEDRGVEWIILRPTLIYGLGRDQNIAEIARFVRRFGFFPVFGEAGGLRQPVHARDVATACLAAIQRSGSANCAYNLSGGETLSYRAMLARVFAALGRRCRLLPVPLSAFRIAVALLRCLPRYRQWTAAMAERMSRDLVFDHGKAARDLNFTPRAFVLSAEDVAVRGKKSATLPVAS